MISDLHLEKVSVFMPTNGNLAANWLDAQGNTIEIEFNGDRDITFFDGGTGEESVVGADRLGDLRRAIGRLEVA